MIPDNSKKKLEQLRQEAALRAQLQQQYDKEMSGKYTRDMPSFSEWLDKRQQSKAKGGKVEVRATVKDEALMRKIPQMEAAAKKVSEGKMSHEAYDKVVNKHKPVKPYEFVPKPASDEDAHRALMENKKPHWRGHENWPAGRKVGLRLDIPAYENHGVWVNSIHDEEGKGEDKRNTSYGSVSSVKNATFDAGPTKAIKVATGEQNKSPFARIKGELHHMTEDEAVAHMQKNLNHPDYAQVGMDPRRHGYFYDRKTMKPVTHAEHVVQIGPLVLAHKPTYGERDTYAKGGVIHKAEGGTVNTFDYENPKHVQNVASIASKHRDFKQIPDAAKHLAGALSQGSYKFIEDPRIQTAIKQAGHNGYYINGKEGKQQIVRKAEGGAVLPLEQIKAQMMNRFKGLSTLQSVGAEEAPSMGVKAYVPTTGRPDNGQMPVGGIDTQQGDLPVGGIDMNTMQAGQQLMPNAPPTPAGTQQGMNQVPAGDKINTMDGTGMPPNPNSNPNQMGSNILSMTPQGQAMAAMKPAGLKKGGNVSIEQMKSELASRKRPLCMTDEHGYADGGHVFEEAEEPKQTVKAYKLFRTEKKHPGKLFPLFVDANTPVEMGKWLAAKEGEMRGSKVKSKIGDLAYRPGWHAGDLPVATHIGEKSHPSLTAPDTRPEHHVWAEVEMPHDVDWQSEANKRGTNSKGNIVPVKAHITDQIPHGGHYRYKTNPNMTGNWLIGGAMKVNRVLSDAEVKKINKAAKTADLPRAKPLNLAKHGFAQGGSTKGYVVHTPKKPHAEVGQRFTATPQGNLVAPQQFDIMKHENKGSIVPIPYDATTRDKLVTEVSGHQLNNPLLTEAGFDYSMDPSHMAQNIGGASNLGIAGRVQKRIDQAAREHEGDVFLAPNTMSEDAENFSHHPAHIVLDLMKQRQLNKKTLKALSDDLRSQFEYVKTPKGTQKVFPYKNFLGFDHPNMMEQVMKGGYGLDTTSGNLRKKLMERLGQVNVQKLLDYNLGDLKASILDPDIASDPKAYMGRTFVKAQAGAPLRLSRHKSYDTDYTGTYAGGLGGNRPLEILMPDVYSDIEKELLQRPAKVVKTPAQHRAQVVGALEKRKEKFAQPINARVINNAGLYEEGLRQGEFDPKNVDSVLAYFKRKGGYKAGGKVKLHTDQDTMQLALTKKSKKAK